MIRNYYEQKFVLIIKHQFQFYWEEIPSYHNYKGKTISHLNAFESYQQVVSIKMCL